LLDKSSSTRLVFAPSSSSTAPLHARSRHLQLPAAFSTSTSSVDDEDEEDESSAVAFAFRKAVLARHSTKAFDATRPVSDETVAAVLGLTLRSPTSFNVQPYTITIVQSKEMKQRLAACMLGPNKARVLQAPLTAVFAADLDPVQLVPRVQTMERQERGLPEAYLATLPFSVSFLAGKGHLAHAFKDLFTSAMSPLQPMPSVSTLEAWSFKNTAIAASWYMMACSAHGLDTCPMEGFDGRRIMQVLRIPSARYAIPLVVSTGYELPAAAAAAAAGKAGKGGGGPKKSPRFPPEAVVFRDAYGRPYKGIPVL
jgi:nitroreductase